MRTLYRCATTATKAYWEVVFAGRGRLVVQRQVGVDEVRLVRLQTVDLAPLVVEQGDGADPEQQHEDHNRYLEKKLDHLLKTYGSLLFLHLIYLCLYFRRVDFLFYKLYK